MPAQLDRVIVRSVTRRESDDRRAVGRELMLELAHELLARQSLPADASLLIAAPCPDCALDHGRPVILGDSDAATRLRVSAAHSGPVTVAAAALDRDVGVDVEHRPTTERLEAIVALTSTASALADPLLHWLRVEAVLKADGRGLRVDPRDVHVTPAVAGRAIARIVGEDVAYEIDEVCIHADYRVCVALRR